MSEDRQDPIKILIIQDNPDYVSLIRRRLAEDAGFVSGIEYAMTLRDGLNRLAAGGVDIVLLELDLPDSRGLDTFDRIQTQSPAVPVILLTSLYDEWIALQLVRRGAQDYILKGELHGKFLQRVIRHAIERQRMCSRLINLSLMDDLTGLYNRRGFYLLAEQQLKLAARSKRELLLMMVDVDGLKKINDQLGHPQGDVALVQSGNVLKKTFRNSDILGRVGGDEFAVLAIDAQPSHAEIIEKRLFDQLHEFNTQSRLPFTLSMTCGFAPFEINRTAFLEQMILKADQSLYRVKKERQGQVAVLRRDGLPHEKLNERN